MIEPKQILAVLLSAAITFFLRALPFFAFSGSRQMPRWLENLGKRLPVGILAVLVVYCMKDIPGAPLTQALPQLLAAAWVAGTYLWKHNTLLSVFSGTAVYMVLIRVMP